MPITLPTLLKRIPTLPNKASAKALHEFDKFMQSLDASDNHRRNELYANIMFAEYLGEDLSLTDVSDREKIIEFLDTKKKSKDVDPDEKWKTTWNDYLAAIKHFYRWLRNGRGKHDIEPEAMEEWETPDMARIRKKRVKRKSTYKPSEIWSREEILTIVKYERYPQNKAAWTAAFDLDARNHELTLLKIEDVVLRDRYGEGQIPFQAKTGSGPILLTLSFPYVRDWLNVHPFKNNPKARIFCDLFTGKPIKSEAIWRRLKALKKRITLLLRNGQIVDPVERSKLEFLLKTKRWNPYCIRHSAIRYDGDTLPEFGLRKKVRWSMNSKQPGRYMDGSMGNALKAQILAREGIVDEVIKGKPMLHVCPDCNTVNSIEHEFCTKCRYPMTPKAMEEVRKQNEKKMREMVKEEARKFVDTLLETPGAIDAIRERKRKAKKSQ